MNPLRLTSSDCTAKSSGSKWKNGRFVVWESQYVRRLGVSTITNKPPGLRSFHANLRVSILSLISWCSKTAAIKNTSTDSWLFAISVNSSVGFTNQKLQLSISIILTLSFAAIIDFSSISYPSIFLTKGANAAVLDPGPQPISTTFLPSNSIWLPSHGTTCSRTFVYLLNTFASISCLPAGDFRNCLSYELK